MGLFSRFKKTTPATDDDGVLDDELNEDDEHEAGTTESGAEAVAADEESDGADADEDVDEDEALLEKSAPFDRAELGRLLDLAQTGCAKLSELQRDALAGTRDAGA